VRSTALALACALVTACSAADMSPGAADPAAPASAIPPGSDEVAAVQNAQAPAVAVTDERANAVEREMPPAAPATPPPSAGPAKADHASADQWRGTPVVADDPVALTQQLIMAERAIRDPSVTGEKLLWMGHLQQLVYRRLIERPQWRDAVFAAIPGDIRAAADLNIAATVDLRPKGKVRVSVLPSWRIVEPAAIDELLGYYRAAQADSGVPWYYLAAINLVETRMGRIRGNSYAGAQGPMQFMPATWAGYGRGNVNDPHDAILAAARLLRATGAPANMPKAIWWYNHDDDYVDAVMKYAAVMRADPMAYRGYYGWQVYFITASAEVLLPVGWPKD
jgi:hypothetical protein